MARRLRSGSVPFRSALQRMFAQHARLPNSTAVESALHAFSHYTGAGSAAGFNIRRRMGAIVVQPTAASGAPHGGDWRAANSGVRVMHNAVRWTPLPPQWPQAETGNNVDESVRPVAVDAKTSDNWICSATLARFVSRRFMNFFLGGRGERVGGLGGRSVGGYQKY